MHVRAAAGCLTGPEAALPPSLPAGHSSWASGPAFPKPLRLSSAQSLMPLPPTLPFSCPGPWFLLADNIVCLRGVGKG